MEKEDSLQRGLFLHIQKTAGTSIVDLARIAYGNENVVSHGDYLVGCQDRTLDKIVDSRGQSPRDFQDIPFVSGHFGYDFARSLLSGRYSFTFLRDPAERILSYYYFSRSRDPEEYEIYALAQKLTLDEFLALGLEKPALKACIWNNQAWQLAHGYGNSDKRNILMFSEKEILSLAIQHLDDFSHVGFTETFAEDRDIILKELGITPPTENIVSNATLGRPKRQELSSSSLKLLHELTKLDQELYDVAWARFKKGGFWSGFSALVEKLRMKFGAPRS